jgi:acyl-CoA synthetase (AMP-forming)/AMP-acid ligase II
MIAREFSTLVHALRDRAERMPERPAYRFLNDGEADEVVSTYGDLDLRARRIAGVLQGHGLAGQRALMLYPPGLEFVAGFFGCLYASTIAVPAYPPDLARARWSLPRLSGIIAECRPAAILTVAELFVFKDLLLSQMPELADLTWIVTDRLDDPGPAGWTMPAIDEDTIAFLQYTSGSTSAPKGVILSHRNVLSNQRVIHATMGQDESSCVAGWLPLYHDMGLIGNVLHALYLPAPCVLMSPLHFLQQPVRWLQAISRYRATISGAPNFAYELCVRKVTPAQRDALDLSSWNVAFTCAEPVRAETIERFAEYFKPCGFDVDAVFPCYGLAEATLMVSGGTKKRPRVVKALDPELLAQQRAVEIEPGDRARRLVGSGRVERDHRIEIVDPDTSMPCREHEIGEIWVSGPSVARGYWNRPVETEQTFDARLAGTGEGGFLRTGDLGFLDGQELFVTGRRKDMIIIRGRKLYPHDLELTAERSHPGFRSGGSAAVAIELDGEERLALIMEFEDRRVPEASTAIAAARLRLAEEHQVQTHTIALIRARTLPKTSSGKVRRQACREALATGDLDIVARA